MKQSFWKSRNLWRAVISAFAVMALFLSIAFWLDWSETVRFWGCILAGLATYIAVLYWLDFVHRKKEEK